MKLTWAPDVAGVATDGSLGYTIGSFEMKMDGPGGIPVSRVGKYKTTWRRADDGSWQVVADMFNFDAPMPAE